MTANKAQKAVADALTYCKGHCDSETESEIVAWVEERIGDFWQLYASGKRA